jgi:hypothetical protein
MRSANGATTLPTRPYGPKQHPAPKRRVPSAATLGVQVQCLGAIIVEPRLVRETVGEQDVAVVVGQPQVLDRIGQPDALEPLAGRGVRVAQVNQIVVPKTDHKPV